VNAIEAIHDRFHAACEGIQSGQLTFLAACRTFIPEEAFAQNLSEFGAPQGKSCFANVVSTWTFAL
jgi:hypothetical protein